MTAPNVVAPTPAARDYSLSLRSSDLTDANVQRILNTGTLFDAKQAFEQNLSKSVTTAVFPQLAYFEIAPALADPAKKTAVATSIADLYRQSGSAATLFDMAAGTNGHAATMANKTDHGSLAAQHVKDPSYPLASVLASWPTGSFFLSADQGAALAAALDQSQFLLDHKAEIQTFHQSLLTTRKPEGWSFTGNYVLLGGELARCEGHNISQQPDGRTVQSLNLVSPNGSDAAQLFSWVHDPADPTSVVASCVQVGKEARIDTPSSASRSGVALFAYATDPKRTIVIDASGHDQTTIDADVARIPLDRFNVIVTRSLFDSTASANARQRLSPAPVLPRVELNSGAITAIANGGPASLDNMALPPATSRGITVDGASFQPVDGAFGSALAPNGAKDAAQTRDTLLRFTSNQASWSNIKRDVSAYAAGQMGGDWASKSSSEIMDRLIGSDQSRLAIESIVSKYLYAPIEPQLTASMQTPDKSAQDVADLADYTRSGFRSAVTVPLLTSDGALRSALQLQILDNQVRMVDRAALDGKIADATARATAARAEVDRLKTVRPADDTDAKRIADELAAHEADESAASDDSDRFTEQRDDVDHQDQVRSDAQQREDSHAKAVFGER
jgi:hypothetical protein